MLTRSRSQRAERADDVLARTLGGVLKLDEEKVGVGFALVGLLVLREIHRTLLISYIYIYSIKLNIIALSYYLRLPVNFGRNERACPPKEAKN